MPNQLFSIFLQRLPEPDNPGVCEGHFVPYSMSEGTCWRGVLSPARVDQVLHWTWETRVGPQAATSHRPAGP